MSSRPAIGKRELVEILATQADISAMSAERALNALVEVVSTALKEDRSVSFGGFGTFEPRKRAARTGRNPKTGEPIDIPAKRVAAFKPGAALKREMESVGPPDVDS